MAAAAQCATPSTQRYQRRRPEQTLWYRIVQTNLETWLELSTGPSGESRHLPMSSAPFAAISNAASWLTASHALTVMSASTIS